MINIFRITSLVLLGITITACQTTTQNSLTTNDVIVEAPTILINIDSDNDSVANNIDQCPGTPHNMVIDENGCPVQPIGIGLKMEYRAFFEKGNSELVPEYQVELDKIAAKMNEHGKSTFRIEAHASADEINKELSSLPKNRALIIKNYLLLKHSIESSRLITSDCKANAPIARDAKNVALNRRVYGVLTEPEDKKLYQDLNGSESASCVEFK